MDGLYSCRPEKSMQQSWALASASGKGEPGLGWGRVSDETLLGVAAWLGRRLIALLCVQVVAEDCGGEALRQGP